MNTQRLVFLSADNPRDITKSSGMVYSIFHALTESSAKHSPNVKIEWIGGAVGLLAFVARLLNKTFRQFGIAIDCRFSTLYALIAGCYLTIRLLFSSNGTVVAILASNYVPYVITKRKLIYISDATFQAI